MQRDYIYHSHTRTMCATCCAIIDGKIVYDDKFRSEDIMRAVGSVALVGNQHISVPRLLAPLVFILCLLMMGCGIHHNEYFVDKTWNKVYEVQEDYLAHGFSEGLAAIESCDSDAKYTA